MSEPSSSPQLRAAPAPQQLTVPDLTALATVAQAIVGPQEATKRLGLQVEAKEIEANERRERRLWSPSLPWSFPSSHSLRC
jgi:hypothetical protein